MQVPSSKLPQSPKYTPKTSSQVQSESQEIEQPKDSFGTTVKNEALGNARHFSDRAANIVGGAGGVIGASLGASAALAGGAIVGMAAGGAVGMPISTLFSSGGLDFIKTGLSSVGVGAQIGIGVGLVTLAAGGWVVGDKLAGTTAKVATYPVGLATGTANGVLRHLGQEAGALPPLAQEKAPEKPPIVSDKSRFMAGTQYALTGSGGLIGLAGGATIGMAVGAGMETISGIFNGDLGISGVTRAGLIGAGIGGGAGAIVGATGGFKISDMIHSGLNGIAETARISETLLEQDKRGNILDELEQRIDQNAAEFAQEKQAGETNIGNREGSLAARGESLSEEREVLNDKMTNEQGLTQARSDELYSLENARLNEFEDKLDGRKAHLDSEKSRLEGKEADVPELTRTEATRRLDSHKAAEQGKYDNRKGNLENREDGLQQRERDIDRIANDRVQTELNPLREQAADARSDASANRRQAGDLRNEASRLEAAVPGMLSDARGYDRQADIQESTNSGLRSEESRLSREESSVSSSLSSCQADKRRREAEAAAAAAAARRAAEQAAARRRQQSSSSSSSGSWNSGSSSSHRSSSRSSGSSSHRSSSSWGGSSSSRSTSRSSSSSSSHRSSSRSSSSSGHRSRSKW